MKVAVKDACVLIDLANGGLLDSWFELGFETHTTDFVINQVQREAQWRVVSGFVQAGLLKVETLNAAELSQMQTEYQESRLGIEDNSALFLAVKLKAVLITGDRRLRSQAEKRSVKVHGVLWILDQLIAANKIVPKLAAAKLRAMIDEGAYLPSEEVNKRFRDWSGGSDATG
ncbi:MAG: hypothetical protein L0Y58_00085 [Verrucomicrobia subdivision 3 bacterium]|nr:hypothetical protein [Limisphaerales bacterium]